MIALFGVFCCCYTMYASMLVCILVSYPFYAISWSVICECDIVQTINLAQFCAISYVIVYHSKSKLRGVIQQF